MYRDTFDSTKLPIFFISTADNDVVVKIIGKKVERNGKFYLVGEKIKHTFETGG
jgi:hypothetical protein